MKTLLACIVLFVLSVTVSSVKAVSFGQIDDFQTGTVMGWVEGAPSPNPPLVNFNGGPGGLGDHSLQNVSSGIPGAGGKMLMYNQAQWTGDYIAAGVNGISGLLKVPLGANPLLMRVAIEGNLNQRYSTLTAIPIPADGAWHAVVFGLTAADLTQVAGIDPLNVVLTNVTTLRILHSTAPNWHGGDIPSTLDVDNLTALPEPGVMVLLTLGGLACVRKRRRKLT